MTLDRNDDIRREGDTDAPAEAGDENAEVAELRADIEETRLEMGGTLNELGDRLEPGHLVEQAKENVREATIGRVEETARGMSDMVMETIKQNPIPAAIAGAGLALLWMNRSSGDGAARNGSYAYRYDPNTGQRLSTRGGIGKDIGQRVSEGASSVGESVGQARETVGEAVGQAGETVGQAVGQAGETVGQTVGQAGQQLDRFMQASPLAMGAIALGAGAVIGAVVPETQVEREKLGEASRQIGETLREGVDQAADQAEQAIDEAERSMSSSRS